MLTVRRSSFVRLTTSKTGTGGYLEVESLPLLGTGKLDLKGLKEMASLSMAQAFNPWAKPNSSSTVAKK